MYNLLTVADFVSATVQSLKSLGVWYLVILNAFGVIAIILKVTEFQLKKRSTVILFALLAALCWVMYFLLQGDLTSAFTCFIGVIQGLIFLQREKYKWASSVLWLYFFVIIQIVSGVLCFKEWHDIFAISAGVLNAFAYFVISRKKYRVLGFACLFAWVLNSTFKFYPLAFVNDLFECISALIAIIRFDIIPSIKKSKN
ncbi:MAG: YgjV family protein [Clostridia bacterium]|nr:YgjV family protein [Clostridia bacterium]